MNLENTPQSADKCPNCASTRKDNQIHRKARPILIDQLINDARERVIRADLELSFITAMKTNSVVNDREYNDFLDQEALWKREYDHFLNRLNFFKEMRDKIKSRDEAKRIEREAREVIETSPDTVEVKINIAE